jgi:hypothetical protein
VDGRRHRSGGLPDYDAWVARVGEDEARWLSYTAAEAARMLDGVLPVTIWRDGQACPRPRWPMPLE